MMAVYRTCFGCVLQQEQCTARSALRDAMKGLRVTSVKWRCDSRRSRFQVGDAVWAKTIETIGQEDACFADFPGVVVGIAGSAALVLIVDGVRSKCGGHRFTAGDGGYCKLPLIRLAPREEGQQR